MYGFFKWFLFLNKSKVVPTDEIHKSSTFHKQLKIIDTFLMNLQSSDSILLNNTMNEEYTVETRCNTLNVKLAAISPYW